MLDEKGDCTEPVKGYSYFILLDGVELKSTNKIVNKVNYLYSFKYGLSDDNLCTTKR